MVQWRTVSPHRRRRPPAGFIAPCLPIVSDEIPVGPAWIHELKWDGYRMIACHGTGPPRLWSRTAHDWASSFPQIIEALGQLPVESVTLDGEAVCLREDGRPDFNRLRTKRGCAEARFIAFDLLELDGQDLRGLTLHERRAMLKGLLMGGPEALWYSIEVEGKNGPSLFRHACRVGTEGIVSKRRDMPYRSGRFHWWRKIKCPDYRRSR
jgi:bifunctional non-homologous end joining protein LigD